MASSKEKLKPDEDGDHFADASAHVKHEDVHKAGGSDVVAGEPFFPAPPPKFVVSFRTIVDACLVGSLVFVMLLVKLLKPNLKETLKFSVVGLVVGLGLSFVYYLNIKKKAILNAKLAVLPGQKGLNALLGHNPSWMTFSERQKAEWLNSIVQELWPHYDRAICAMVKETVEPILNEYKPAGLIKKIWFQKFSLGQSAFRVERFMVKEDTTNHVHIEVDYRWGGDANIVLAIDLPAGGAATRLLPKVRDLSVNGSARILLGPMLKDIPGVGGAMISLNGPPKYRFHLDFGAAALGGSMTAKAIVNWLEPFVKEVLSGMMVWPNRLIVPLADESVTGPLDMFYLKHRGVLRVTAVEADNLNPADFNGKADPFAEFYTLADKPVKTRVINKSLHPEWNETHYVLVQEPTSQKLYCTVSDVDFVNLKELFTLNMLKGASQVFGATELMGRTAIPLQPFCDEPGEEFDDWFFLGTKPFSNADGCGGDAGKIRLKLTYMPFGTHPDPASVKTGAFIVYLKRANNLPAADYGSLSSPFVTFECEGKTLTSKTMADTLNPVWNFPRFDFIGVSPQSYMEVKVFDNDLIGADLLGTLSIPISEVAVAPGGFILKEFPLSNVAADVNNDVVPDATITLRLEWGPYE